MGNTLKVKRGTNLSNAGTPASGELIYKTDTNELFVGDGSTAATGLSAIGGAAGDIEGVTAGNGLTGGGTSGTVDLNIGAGTGIDVAADAISVDVSDFMTNGSNDRILTATGTDAMNAEANLTFTDSNNYLTVHEAGASTGSHLRLATDNSDFFLSASGSSNQLTIYDANAAANRLVVSNSGNFQILNALSVNSSITTGYGVSFTNGNTNFLQYNNSGEDVLYLRDTTNSAMVQTWGVNSVQIHRGLTVNQDGGNYDTRIEGDTDTHLFFVDASADRVGISTSSPGATLDIGDRIYLKDDGTIHWGSAAAHGILSWDTGRAIVTATGANNLDLKAASGYSVVVNESGSNVDFRVEGDSDTNLLFADASTDRIGIGTNSPEELLHVAGVAKIKSSGNTTLFIDGAGNGYTQGQIVFQGTDDDASYRGQGVFYHDAEADIEYFSGTLYANDAWAVTRKTSTASHDSSIAQGSHALFIIEGGGDVGIGTSNPTDKLHIKDATDISMSSSGNGQLRVEGDGYSGGIALDGNAMHIYHNSSSRSLRLGTDETTRYQIDGSGNHNIYGNTSFSSPMSVQYGAVFNEGGHNSDFRVESDNQTNCLLVDASQDRVETFAIVDSATNLGFTGSVSIDSTTNTAQEYSDLPMGYRAMMHANLGTDEGMPVDSQYFYFTKISNRDTGGGWGGLAMGYNDNEQFYVGNTTTSSSFATWSRVVVENASGISTSPVKKITSGDDFVLGELTDNLRIKGSGTQSFNFLGDDNGFATLNAHTYNSGSGFFQSDDASTDVALRRGTNNDDRIIIEASQTRIIGDSVERARFGSWGLRVNYSGSAGTPPYSFVSDTDTGIYSSGADSLNVTTGGNERTQINSLGLKVVNGALGVNVTPNGTDGRIDASNDVVAFSTSDKRLKENIKPLDNALSKVMKISGVEFDWKELTKEEKKTIHGNQGHDVGVIAQEIEEVLPEVVTTRDTGYKAVKYEKLVPLLIESIKELKEEVNGLKAKLGE